MVNRVLIVDDDAVSLVLLRHMLGSQGFDVIEAGSVDEALEVLNQVNVELVVCDYLMPGRNGLDLLEALGESAPPFVLLTGTLSRERLDDDRIAGLTAYVTKPVSTDELREVTAPYVVSAAA